MTRIRRIPIELAALSSQTSDSGSEQLITRFKTMLLREALSNVLTKTQKCYIILYYNEGLSMPEIARRFNVNKSTVSRTIAAARRKLEHRVIWIYKALEK